MADSRVFFSDLKSGRCSSTVEVRLLQWKLYINIGSRDTGLPSAAPLLRGYAKVESLTIAELNNFIITALSKDIVFICTGRVTHVYIGKRVLLRCLLQMQQKTAAHCLRLFFLPSPPLHVCDATILLELHNLRAIEAGQMLAEEGVHPEDS
ncbi:hypothetical protein Bca4012_025853 [Brassica carinata]